MTDDWNPNDPDATRVLYDLDRWSFSQQAELAAELAEAEIPHTWEGSELVVPESHEALADSTIERVEQRLGIINSDDLDEMASGGPSQPASPAEPIDIPVGVAATEYDLTEWAESDRQAITLALTGQRIPYRWEDDLLLVGTDHEDVVESLMDLVETGDFASLELAAGVSESGGAAGRDDDDDLPFETLNTFFLAAERLQRNTQDADGLEQLLDALEVAEPGRRPYGVDVGLWQRTCELADELAGSLVDGDEPDHNTAMAIATDLHELLRPHI
ncbi:MAG: hypothetical protein HY826_03820 [Actinobacteria bacterium]|nr:hypothetical protein [Actinomycetota bacterium]